MRARDSHQLHVVHAMIRSPTTTGRAQRSHAPGTLERWRPSAWPFAQSSGTAAHLGGLGERGWLGLRAGLRFDDGRFAISRRSLSESGDTA